MILDGRDAEWGLLVILACLAELPLARRGSIAVPVAVDRTMLLPTTSQRGDGSEGGRPWLMLKRD